VVIATLDLPAQLPVSGPSMLIESRVVRRKDKNMGNETECVRLSDELVFLEIAMHQQLMLKLKVRQKLRYKTAFLLLLLT
jgi:hypothetical protein